jgi:hypothetical protein
MAFNIGNGLSEMGKSVAQTAQAYTIEAQKAELETQRLKLANDLAMERESVGRRESAAFAETAAEKQRGWQSGEFQLNRDSEERRAKAQNETSLAVAGTSAAATRYSADKRAEEAKNRLALETEQLTPAEVRIAKWLTKATPEELAGYQAMHSAKLRPAAPLSGFQPSSDGGLEPIPGGPEDPKRIAEKEDAKRPATEKAIPGQQLVGLQENLTALKKIDGALTQLDKVPGSVGGIGSFLAEKFPDVGGNIQNRMDPAGTNLRALIADIGSMKVHQRSGAAVTASEMPRLKPFVPGLSDDPATVRNKLQNFAAEYEAVTKETLKYFSAENGFKPYTSAIDYLQGRGTPGAPRLSKEEYDTAPSGTRFTAPDGKIRVKP